jgi:hypothetical protein
VKYMMTWSFAPEKFDAVKKRFGENAEPMDGITQISRWHEVGTGRGFRVIETDDPVALTKLNIYWSDLLVLKTVPVVDDEAAAKALFS